MVFANWRGFSGGMKGECLALGREASLVPLNFAAEGGRAYIGQSL